MADIALIIAYLYLFVVLVAVAYRGYGISARSIARHVAERALSSLGGKLKVKDSSANIENLIAEIFENNNIVEEEFGTFAEMSLASYVFQKDRTALLLKNANDEKDIQIRILGHLLHRSLRDRAYLETLVEKLQVDAHSSIVSDFFVRVIAKGRLERYAHEFATGLLVDFSIAPQRMNKFVNAKLLQKLTK